MFGLRTVGVWSYPKPWPREHDCLLQVIKDAPLHYLRITSNEIHYTKDGKHRMVHAECEECGKVSEISVDNILAGKTRGCKCAGRYQDPKSLRLADRYHAIQQRCTNPSSQSWRNYGARGIRNCFKSAEEFVSYVLEHFPHKDYKGLAIGRIDNDGHYEPGNIQLESPGQNMRNTRRNVMVDYKGEMITATDLYYRLCADYPGFGLCLGRTRRLAATGVHWQEILQRTPRKRRSTTS